MKREVNIERLVVHADARGAVYEPLLPEQLPGQQNVHVVVTEPGQVRGNHYHTAGTELLTVLGPALVKWRDVSAANESPANAQHIASGEAYRFTIPAGVAHAILATGPEPMLIVAFNSELFDRERPDAVRHVVIDGTSA
jgi:UDP-2-acetamido-2,6-beta-L-arabino-hexul-4-ose reductase